MSHLENKSNIIRLLRLSATAGTIAVALIKFFSVTAIQQNQHYSFYALALVAAGVGLSLFVFLPQTAAKVLKNPDLLVPVGLYITIDGLSGFFIQIPNFSIFNPGGLYFSGITFSLAFLWVFQIAVNICFVGWMTRSILQFVRTEKVDLIESFQNISWWFPRVFAVSIFGWLPIYLLLMLIFLPVFTRGNRGTFELVLLFFIVFVGIFSLIWNLATALLLPFVLSVKAGLKRAVLSGIGFSWKYKRKTFLPIVLLMLVSGWMVFVSVEYTAKENEKAAFGESSIYSETEQSTWNFSSHFIWISDYPENSKWHEQLLKAVKEEPLPSVDFRIMLLLLFLSLVVNLKIVESVWNKNDEVADGAENEGKLKFGIMGFMLVALFLLPFEYLRNYTREDGTGAGISDFVVPKIYTGENFVAKKAFFKIGQQGIVGFTQKDAPADAFSIGKIEDLTVGKDKSVIVSGSSNGIVLDNEGNVKEKIVFDLGPTQDGNSGPAHFNDVKPVDIEDDGIYEFAGVGNYPHAAFLFDHRGRVIVKHQGEGIDVRTADLKDLDADGTKEFLVDEKGTLKVFDLKGKIKWSQPVPSSFLGGNVHFLDTNNDGKNEIVVGGYKSAKVIEAKTENARDIKKPVEQHGFLNRRGNAPAILFFDQNQLGLFDFNGNLVAKYNAPLSYIEDNRLFKDDDNPYSKFANVYKAKAVKLALKAGEPEYLAVLATLSTKSSHYSVDMIYIYDDAGNLVYQESLADGSGVLASFPNENGTESLLISEDKTIWLYTGN